MFSLTSAILRPSAARLLYQSPAMTSATSTGFTAVVYQFRKCVRCDELDHGLFNRLDCGCLWETVVGEYETLNAARLAAMAKSRKKGTWNGGRSTGVWHIESADGSTIDWSKP